MNSMHLIGASDVDRAGRNISAAAQDMYNAANTFSYAVEMFGRHLDRMEQILDAHATRIETAMNRDGNSAG